MVILAFFLLILADEGRIPVDSPAGKVEIAMIGHSKGLEYSGSSAALMKWGGASKLMVLALIFVNVLVTPWGLAATTQWPAVLSAMGLVLLKLLAFVVILALVETTLAKLRLFRISEFLAVAFVICLFAVSIRLVGIA
jgi:formate hydrogenlyase subunit 4